MAALSEAEAAILTARQVAAFNVAVEAGDFTDYLALFADDAVITFENVPGAGELKYAGRDAYAHAYATQPPRDKIDITATARCQGDEVIVPFVWRREGETGTLQMTFTSGTTDDIDERLVKAMTVTFD